MAKAPKRKATKRKVAPASGSQASVPKRAPKKKRSQTHKRVPKEAKKPLLKRVMLWLKVAASLFVVFVVVVIALAFTPVFHIETIEVEPSSHVSKEDALALAQIPENANLINVNPFVITANLKKNPWIDSVEIQRQFPHTLKLVIREKTVRALVPMSATQTVWALAPDKTWIQPVDVSSQDADSLVHAALKLAVQEGSFVLSNISEDLDPQAGKTCDNEKVNVAYQVQSAFHSELALQIAEYDIPAVDSITCTLKSGVEIALGQANQLDIKEKIIDELLKKYENQITYINVRNPSKPSYKKANADELQSGTGIEGTQK